MVETPTVRVSIVGDVFVPPEMFDRWTPEELCTTKRNFLHPFKESDLILLNLEGPVTQQKAERTKKNYNLINDPKILDFFDERFVLCLANNHIMDFGDEGVRDTVAVLKAKGILFAGVGEDIEKVARPIFLESKGVRVAYICAADPRFQPASSVSVGTLPAKTQFLMPLISEARKKADCVVVNIHAGMEFTSVPTPHMINVAENCLRAGARIVIYHHAHCLSGYTESDKGLVLWGTGNYAFPYIIPSGFSPWFQSAAWNVTLKANGDVKIDEIIPIELSGQGMPEIARGNAKNRILTKIERNNKRISEGRRYGLWRLLSVFHPVFIWLAFNNYLGMAARGGWRAVIDHVLSTLSLYRKEISE